MSSYARPLNQTPTFNSSNYTFQDGFITSRLYWLYFAPLVNANTNVPPFFLEKNNIYATFSPLSLYAKVYLNSNNEASLEVPSINTSGIPDVYTDMYFTNLQNINSASSFEYTNTGRAYPFLSVKNNTNPTLSGLAFQPEYINGVGNIITPTQETKLNLWGLIMGGTNNGRAIYSGSILASITRINSLNIIGMTDGTNSISTRQVNIWGEGGIHITGGLRLNNSANPFGRQIVRMVEHIFSPFVAFTTSITLPPKFLTYTDYLAGNIVIYSNIVSSATNNAFPVATHSQSITNSGDNIVVRINTILNGNLLANSYVRIIGICYA